MIPAKCAELVGALLDGGWSFVVNHGKDTGDSPFISVEAGRDRQDVRITWQKRDVTLTKAMEAIRKPVEAS